MDRNEVAVELNRPLDPKHVRPAQQYGPKGDYVEGWHAIAEANRIFGWDGWTREVVDCRCVQERERKIGRAPNQKDGWGVSYVIRVRVVAGGIVREGTGAGHGVDVDIGNAHESAVKEAETDAMKRALMTFGNPFGLALYDKTRANVGTGDPEPDPNEIKLAALVGHLDGATSLDELQSIWTAHARDPVAAAPGAIEAKDRNKDRLSKARAA